MRRRLNRALRPNSDTIMAMPLKYWMHIQYIIAGGLGNGIFAADYGALYKAWSHSWAGLAWCRLLTGATEGENSLIGHLCSSF